MQERAQVAKKRADNQNMDVSGINSFDGALASVASSLKSEGVMQQIGVAVMKQIMDSQKQEAQALIEMMKNIPGPTPGGTGSIVNIAA